MKLELSIIIPTYNEAGNIIPLYNEIKKYLQNIKYSIIFVDDDSKDSTLEEIHTLINNFDNVQLIRRINKRGLSSACIDGFASSNAKYVAVIDADLQHDPLTLQIMLETMTKKNMDLVIASRFLQNSLISGLGQTREKMSILGNQISRIMTGVKLTDPLSGYFMVKREIIEKIIHKLSGKGFKILLDIFITSKINKINLDYLELPTIFRERMAGKSKLDFIVILEFLILLLDKTIGQYISTRFVLFLLVGTSGLIIHLFLVALMLKVFKLYFVWSQTIATFLTMTSNFLINNLFTYRDVKLKGMALLKGLFSFYFVCSAGVLINVTIASFLFQKGIMWWLSGFLGCAIGAVWNYATTSHVIWRNND